MKTARRCFRGNNEWEKNESKEKRRYKRAGIGLQYYDAVWVGFFFFLRDTLLDLLRKKFRGEPVGHTSLRRNTRVFINPLFVFTSSLVTIIRRRRTPILKSPVSRRCVAAFLRRFVFFLSKRRRNKTSDISVVRKKKKKNENFYQNQRRFHAIIIIIIIR